MILRSLQIKINWTALITNLKPNDFKQFKFLFCNSIEGQQQKTKIKIQKIGAQKFELIEIR